MAAECYWCVAGKAAYGSQMGTMGLPFAACHRCQVFVCGHHGQRDDDIQKFNCFDCDKTILIASAINMAEVEPETITEISESSGLKFRDLFLNLDDLFSSFEDFMKRREGYHYFLEEVEQGSIDYSSWPDNNLRKIFIDFPEDAQKLLIMAAILIADTDTMEDLINRGNSLFLNLKSSLRLPSYG